MTDIVDAHMRAAFDRAERAGLSVARLGRAVGWDTSDFVEEAVETVIAGQIEQAGATWEYLTEYVRRLDPADRELLTGPQFDDLIGSKTRGGTPLETVYRRPGSSSDELRRGGMSGVDIDRQVSKMAKQMAETDVAMAGRNAEMAYGAADERVVGWRRVPNSGACKFCRLIAEQVYSIGQLAPAHASCHCGTKPILDAAQP